MKKIVLFVLAASLGIPVGMLLDQPPTVEETCVTFVQNIETETRIRMGYTYPAPLDNLQTYYDYCVAILTLDLPPFEDSLIGELDTSPPETTTTAGA